MEALLRDWMSAHAGFLQYADRRPATDMLPADAVEWLANIATVEQGWVFVGAWLFADRPQAPRSWRIRRSCSTG